MKYNIEWKEGKMNANLAMIHTVRTVADAVCHVANELARLNDNIEKGRLNGGRK